MFTAFVLYPAGGKFDLDYYMKKHMKLVDERWRPLGLTGWSVSRVADAPGTPATYQVITTIQFDSAESFQKAAATHGREVMGDIANFTDGKPLMQLGEVVPA